MASISCLELSVILQLTKLRTGLHAHSFMKNRPDSEGPQDSQEVKAYGALLTPTTM